MNERIIKQKRFTGVRTPDIRPYELEGAAVARRAAVEGIVLLKNEDKVLPVPIGEKIALYGSGATRTIKGGTGAGDVNERHTVSIYEGLKAAGYVITSEGWLSDYENCYSQAREVWKEEILKKAQVGTGFGFFDAYSATPFLIPSGDGIEKETAKADGADTAIFVLARVAGEASDRRLIEGDYYFTATENAQLADLCECYENVILVVNSGGIVDMGVLDKFPKIKGAIYCCQPGQEAGHAFADVFSGKYSPSGRLTDSWAYRYEDYPNSAIFSYNNGNVKTEKYEEGIYVGYRYFDSFETPVRYCFGYGLSYTEFSMKLCNIVFENGELCCRVSVKNTGNCAGKETAQVYLVLPQEGLEKEYRRFAGFVKTKELAPGEEQVVKIIVSLKTLASFWESKSAWIVEGGDYGVFLGSSLERGETVAVIRVTADLILEKTMKVCPLRATLEEMEGNGKVKERYRKWKDGIGKFPVVEISTAYEADGCAIVTCAGAAWTVESDFVEATALAEQMSTEQLVQIVTGDPNKGEDNIDMDVPDIVGSAGLSVPGSAGETSSCAVEHPWNLPSIILADGPAGLRINTDYEVMDGEIIYKDFQSSVEKGIFAKPDRKAKGEKWYQYCTAMPVGTMLAQTFNTELIEEVGKCVAKQMDLFMITLWLAPGMNLHRNPLCGRNFEYYSEDPLLTGKVAAAMVRGVQSIPGCGTTVKHFACNNQEDNRLNSDSILSERTLRELYLRSFEIAVKEAQPMALMTSYNLINGVHAANSYDLCTAVLREEWGFAGLVMTDWLTTSEVTTGECTASGCIRAGNDLIMPGTIADWENLKKELSDGTLTQEQLKLSVSRIVRVILRSNRYENVRLRDWALPDEMDAYRGTPDASRKPKKIKQ